MVWICTVLCQAYVLKVWSEALMLLGGSGTYNKAKLAEIGHWRHALKEVLAACSPTHSFLTAMR